MNFHGDNIPDELDARRVKVLDGNVDNPKKTANLTSLPQMIYLGALKEQPRAFNKNTPGDPNPKHKADNTRIPVLLVLL